MSAPEEVLAPFLLHEPTLMNWDMRIKCSCGEISSHWMEFYRHQGASYKAELTQALADKEYLVGQVEGFYAVYAEWKENQ